MSSPVTDQRLFHLAHLSLFSCLASSLKQKLDACWAEFLPVLSTCLFREKEGRGTQICDMSEFFCTAQKTAQIPQNWLDALWPWTCFGLEKKKRRKNKTPRPSFRTEQKAFSLQLGCSPDWRSTETINMHFVEPLSSFLTARAKRNLNIKSPQPKMWGKRS